MSENNASMRPSRIRPDTPQVEPPPSGGVGGGGDGGPAKVWTISGRLCVRESQIDGEVHDRPLKGIEVGENVRTMLKRCIDPLATDEPRDALAVRRSA